jgi:hypothetical protein
MKCLLTCADVMTVLRAADVTADHTVEEVVEADATAETAAGAQEIALDDAQDVADTAAALAVELRAVAAAQGELARAGEALSMARKKEARARPVQFDFTTGD